MFRASPVGGKRGWGRVCVGVIAQLAAVLMVCAGEMEPASGDVRAGGGRGEVVGVRDDLAFRDHAANGAVIASMLHEGLILAGGAGVDEKCPLRSFVGPSDRVGVKVSMEGGPIAGTKRALVEALVVELGRAGVPPEQIIVWDKREEGLVTAGFRMSNQPKKMRVLSVLPGQFPGTGAGFDRQVFYRGSSVGELIWGDLEFVGARPSPQREVEGWAKGGAKKGRPPKLSDPFSTATMDADTESVPRQGSVKSHVTRIITQMCTKVIHVPALADNVALGLDGAMGALAMGSVDNWRRFMYNPEEAAALAEICAMPEIREKVVLTILDATYTQYAGGPGFVPRYGAITNTLYLSRDMVALDALGLDQIDSRRRGMQIPPISEISSWVAAAGELGLGEADRRKVKVRWAEGSGGGN